MRRCWKNVLTIPLVAAAVLAGCEAADTGSITAPAESRSGLLGLLGSSTSRFTLVDDPLVPGITSSLSSSALIGLDGGTVTLLGHTLAVPAGAVPQPTLFTLTVLPTGYVEVDLTATVSSVLGLVLNVGSEGFLKPVPVTLTYSRATNIDAPGELQIVHLRGLLGYRDMMPLPSRVDLRNQTVTADLEHFSRYSIAMP